MLGGCSPEGAQINTKCCTSNLMLDGGLPGFLCTGCGQLGPTTRNYEGLGNSPEGKNIEQSAAQVTKDHRVPAIISAAEATGKLARSRRHVGGYS